MPDSIDFPSDVDPELWFISDRPMCQGGQDYLFDSHWHTFPGRMAAYCPHDPDHPNYRVSFRDLPTDLPSATRYWVRGFLAGNLPPVPDIDLDDDDPRMIEWSTRALDFARTGDWPVDPSVD